MTDLAALPRRVWKSAQLFIGFHRDAKGRQRPAAHVWPPKDANATIHADPAQQEAFIVVKSASSTATDDIQIKLRPDAIVLRRDQSIGWNGIKVDDCTVTVLVNNIEISISADGSIRRVVEDNTTWIEADGHVLRKTEFVEASMSGDGVDLIRRTEDHIAAISANGVLSKNK